MSDRLFSASFRVPLIPVAWKRPRAFVQNGRARVFQSKDERRATDEFLAFADPHRPPEPLEGALSLALDFVLPIPASKPAWWREAAARAQIYPRGPKDTDNLAKLVLDALTRSGQWWKDDAQVVRLIAAKQYGATPQTIVTVYEMAEAQNPKRTRPEAATDQAAML